MNVSREHWFYSRARAVFEFDPIQVTQQFHAISKPKNSTTSFNNNKIILQCKNMHLFPIKNCAFAEYVGVNWGIKNDALIDFNWEPWWVGTWLRAHSAPIQKSCCAIIKQGMIVNWYFPIALSLSRGSRPHPEPDTFNYIIVSGGRCSPASWNGIVADYCSTALTCQFIV